MRYFMAIFGALVGAGLIAFFVGIPVADWAVSQQRFQNPIQADDMHMWVYLGCMLAGLIGGWMLGWGVGTRFENDDLDL